MVSGDTFPSVPTYSLIPKFLECLKVSTHSTPTAVIDFDHENQFQDCDKQESEGDQEEFIAKSITVYSDLAAENSDQWTVAVAQIARELTDHLLD